MNFLLKLDIKYLLYSCGTVLAAILGKQISKYLNNKRKYVYLCINLTGEDVLSNGDTLRSLSYLKCFVDFINEAQTSLDICFYLITDRTTVDAIINANRRNVQVRIITDYHSGIYNNRFARELFKEGLKIYYDENDPGRTIMHNKFCIRDKTTLLFSSMNLTENVARGSFENITITTDPEFLRPFIQYFQEVVDDLK